MKKSKKKKSAPKKKAQKVVSSKTSLGFQPTADRILVKPIAQDTVTSFGIIIPDTAKEKPEQGLVVAVGPGRRGDNSELIPLGLKVGQKIIFSKYSHDEIKLNGTEYYLLREDNILGIFE